MQRIQLYATGSASGTSVAQVTIPSAGKIKGVIVDATFLSKTDGAVCRLEFSKVPTNQIATNGALDPFLEIGSTSNFVTSGLDQNAVNGFFPVDVDVRQGEIIYVHATVAGTVTYTVNAILYYGG